jgi:hypothetical protein
VPLTLLSSVIVYSGALQFAMVALLGVGTAVPPLLLTALVLNLRHVVLGAALRARLESGPLGRAGLATATLLGEGGTLAAPFILGAAAGALAAGLPGGRRDRLRGGSPAGLIRERVSDARARCP